MNRISTFLATAFLSFLSAGAVTPWQCQGSAMPYIAPDHVVAHPDSLTPMMINHVGRHGARYLSSHKKVDKLLKFLNECDSAATLTPLGRELQSLAEKVDSLSRGHWGALDSVGMDEQAGIARRLCLAYPHLVRGAVIEARSSYVPRCIMSMDCFTHEIARLDNDVTINAISGRVNSPILRPFDLDSSYIAYRAQEPYKHQYGQFYDSTMPASPAARLTTQTLDEKKLRDISMEEFGMLAGLNAMGLPTDLTRYFTPDELNAIWQVRNLDQYLVRTANCFSAAPAAIAASLLRDLITTTDGFIAGKSHSPILLRFGHAETMLPLLSLMQLPGCYYISSDLASVSDHWQNFNVVPMASNLQLKIFRAPSGTFYVRADLNEVPVPLIAGRLYIPWAEARAHLLSLLPTNN